jgi:uncharacterized membrane protein SpoIIM required for sporulation
VDYSRFVAHRRKIWDELEARLGAVRRQARSLSHEDLEQIAIQYRQVLHDHALIDARYPGTGAAARLRRLALQGTHFLHQHHGSHRLSLPYFFGTLFPRAFQQHLRPLGLAVSLFLVATIFGLGMAAAQPAVGALILGPERIAGLKEGHLWTEALTTTVPPSYSSSFIATNNMSVGLAAWVLGATAGLGSIYVLLLNGLMLGSIFGITMHYRMAPALLEFIAAHGPLELTLIMVCSAAGLGLAGALVIAEDRPRWQVLRERTRSSLLLLLGCLPWFLVLGLVEALVSPSPDLPALFKVVLGLSLEALFLAVALRPLARPSTQNRSAVPATTSPRPQRVSQEQP